jgi:hypothetical protein
LEVLAMEDAGILYGHLVNYQAIWYIFGTLVGIFCVFWYIFPILVYCATKNLATIQTSSLVRFKQNNFILCVKHSR